MNHLIVIALPRSAGTWLTQIVERKCLPQMRGPYAIKYEVLWSLNNWANDFYEDNWQINRFSMKYEDFQRKIMDALFFGDKSSPANQQEGDEEKPRIMKAVCFPEIAYKYAKEKGIKVLLKRRDPAMIVHCSERRGIRGDEKMLDNIRKTVFDFETAEDLLKYVCWLEEKKFPEWAEEDGTVMIDHEPFVHCPDVLWKCLRKLGYDPVEYNYLNEKTKQIRDERARRKGEKRYKELRKHAAELDMGELEEKFGTSEEKMIDNLRNVLMKDEEVGITNRGTHQGEKIFLYSLVRMLKPKKVVELGVSEGNTTPYLSAASYDEESEIDILGVDDWSRKDGGAAESGKKAKDRLRELGVEEVVRLETNDALNFLQKEPSCSAEIIFIDADHSFDFTRKIIKEAQRVSSNVVIVHDCSNIASVRRACEEFEGVFIDAMYGLWICQSSQYDFSYERLHRLEERVNVSGGGSEHIALFDTVAKSKMPYPGGYAGRGIIIPAGGKKLFVNGWVCLKMLREMGCDLPVEMWHLPGEKRKWMAELIEKEEGVEFVAAENKQWLKGWELKPYSVINSKFKEILLLDADNMPVKDPSFLFECEEFKDTGVIFWPDFTHLAEDREIWKLCGVDYKDEPEFESGQLVIDKERCWHALQLTLTMNKSSNFWYHYIYGDKETWHMSWRKLDQPYSMPNEGIHGLDGVMCQHDFEGERLFQHRNMCKWTLGKNRKVDGYWFGEKCREFIEEVREKVPSFKFNKEKCSKKDLLLAEELCETDWIYERVGHDKRKMSFSMEGKVEKGKAGREETWTLRRGILYIYGKDEDLTCELEKKEDIWDGRWVCHERMPIILKCV